jgi:hypothetical protein
MGKLRADADTAAKARGTRLDKAPDPAVKRMGSAFKVKTSQSAPCGAKTSAGGTPGRPQKPLSARTDMA